jgi:hypothetical protein|tara:strand:+ start:39 stop:269 length:231 start_codon:yes stop_codon:yes gene_type:complete
MSRIKVDEICNFAENGAVSAIEGLTIPSGKKLTLSGARTIASSTDTGTEGEICWDADYLYVCVGTDTWKRIALATW